MMMKTIGCEAPAIRVKEVDGSDNVIGMAAVPVQFIITVETMEETSKKQLIAHILEHYQEHKNLQLIMVKSGDCDSLNCTNKEKFRVVYDRESAFIQKYFTKDTDAFKGGCVIVDRNGEIVYIGAFSADSKLPEVFEAIHGVVETATKDKKGSHNHEDWMRT